MFQVGDVVCLRSGGPEMTVNSVRDQSDGTVEVNYFVGDDLYDAVFDVDMLELSEIEDEVELTDERIAELRAKYPNGLSDLIVMVDDLELTDELIEDEYEAELKRDIDEYLKERPIGGAGN